jgi:large subunit ribosomal protein L17
LKKLFEEVAPEFKDRNGGYLRIVKSGFRKGDGASMAIVQLLIKNKVEEEKDKGNKTAKKKTKAAAKKSSKEASKKE